MVGCQVFGRACKNGKLSFASTSVRGQYVVEMVSLVLMAQLRQKSDRKPPSEI